MEPIVRVRRTARLQTPLGVLKRGVAAVRGSGKANRDRPGARTLPVGRGTIRIADGRKQGRTAVSKARLGVWLGLPAGNQGRDSWLRLMY